MLRVARRLLLVLIAFAIVGGTTAQLAWPARSVAPLTMVGMSCDMMMPATGMKHDKPTMPYKGTTQDCMKQICCVADVSLPARFASHEFAARFTMVDYWSALSAQTGLAGTPEPIPPRTT